MDDKDKLLLDLLRRDARRPVVALARDLGLSRTATQDRLARLQASGAIARFTIVAGDPDAREAAYLIIRLEAGTRCAQIVPSIRSLPGVEAVDSLAGPFDLIVRVSADSIKRIGKVRMTLAQHAGVAEVTTHVVLERWTN